ncbi:MAG: hypothetical protein ACREHC_02325 [Candidatus Levyibacteriota bacterium]
MKKQKDHDCSHIFTRFYETDDGAIVNACMDCTWKYVFDAEQEDTWREAMEEALL